MWSQGFLCTAQALDLGISDFLKNTPFGTPTKFRTRAWSTSSSPKSVPSVVSVTVLVFRPRRSRASTTAGQATTRTGTTNTCAQKTEWKSFEKDSKRYWPPWPPAVGVARDEPFAAAPWSRQLGLASLLALALSFSTFRFKTFFALLILRLFGATGSCAASLVVEGRFWNLCHGCLWNRVQTCWCGRRRGYSCDMCVLQLFPIRCLYHVWVCIVHFCVYFSGCGGVLSSLVRTIRRAYCVMGKAVHWASPKMVWGSVSLLQALLWRWLLHFLSCAGSLQNWCTGFLGRGPDLPARAAAAPVLLRHVCFSDCLHFNTICRGVITGSTIFDI